MRFAIAITALILSATAADAQAFGRGRAYSYPSCPGGVCPAPQQFGAPLTMPTNPGPGYELWLVNGQLVYRPVAAAPKAMESASPEVPAEIRAMYGAKAPAAGPKAQGGAFYRVVRNRTEAKLADKLVSEKGLKPADARAKARQLVADLDDPTIDACAKRCGIVETVIAEGGPLERLIDWILANPEKIRALIELLLSLLMIFA